MKLPDFTLPKALGQLGERLPQQPPAFVLVTALNLAMGRLIPKEPLQALLGKHLKIRVTDAGMSLRFTLTEKGFRPSFSGAESDLTISARTRDFLALALREEDADTLFFSRRLLMEGDTELGLLVKNTLDAVEIPKLSLPRLQALGRFSPQVILGQLSSRLLWR